MAKPVLIIVNGLPGTGKSTLANRLAKDLSLPVFSRDTIYEKLFDALKLDTNKSSLGLAAFDLLYHIISSILAAQQGLIVEGFFGRPELRTAEFVSVQRRHDFEPFQILCKADGRVLLERFLARAGSEDRHKGHHDLEWLEQNQARLLSGLLPPLELDGQFVEIDTTTSDSFDYDALLRRLRLALL